MIRRRCFSIVSTSTIFDSGNLSLFDFRVSQLRNYGRKKWRAEECENGRSRQEVSKEQLYDSIVEFGFDTYRSRRRRERVVQILRTKSECPLDEKELDR